MSQQWRIHTMLKVTNMLLIMKFIVSTVTSYYDIHNDIYFADSDSDYRGSDVNCCWSSDVIFVDSDAQFDVFPPNVYYKNANFWLIFGTNVWQFIVVFLTFWRHLLYLFSVFTSPDVSSLHFAISFLHTVLLAHSTGYLWLVLAMWCIASMCALVSRIFFVLL